MRFPRASGILLHPTSLPGRFGIGDLGPAARRFVEFLISARQGVWQVLPLGPTGYGDSPYQCFSAFAGNPLLVSPEDLLDAGILRPEDLAGLPALPDDQVDFGAAIPVKQSLHARAAARLDAAPAAGLASAFDAFCRDEAHWLEDYALFMALKEEHGGAPWNTWETGLQRRKTAALSRARARLAGELARHRRLQFLFFHQWRALRSLAGAHGIRLVGDLPIFVAYDSADVWAHPELFFLDPRGRPTVVAGVPPDYFSATGQLWGNPLYRWDAAERDGYAWWIARIRSAVALFDVVRIDHFIGFTRYWEVRAGDETAIGGRWRPGPGAALFSALQQAIGTDLPIIAEDLGAVTPEVEALRDRFSLPGMKVLQFAFGGPATSPFLPHRYTTNCVVYTGTHDNDTTVGWFRTASPEERAHAQRYLARGGEDISYDFIRAAMSSVADTAVAPLQDVLALGSEARMNVPGRPEGNWRWRFAAEALNGYHVARLAEMAELYDRNDDAGADADEQDATGDDPAGPSPAIVDLSARPSPKAG